MPAQDDRRAIPDIREILLSVSATEEIAMGPEDTAVVATATKLEKFIDSLSKREQAAFMAIMDDAIRRSKEFASAMETTGILSSWVRSGQSPAIGW
jgi:hypothetical protein